MKTSKLHATRAELLRCRLHWLAAQTLARLPHAFSARTRQNKQKKNDLWKATEIVAGFHSSPVISFCSHGMWQNFVSTKFSLIVRRM